MKSGNSNLGQSKASVRSRRGIATVELLIALPLITTAFVTLMFVAHTSHIKNGDYHRQYVIGMSRHTLTPPKFESSLVTTLDRIPLSMNQSFVQGSFPDTETWKTTVSQSLKYVPGNFEEGDWKTNDFVGELYKGTGSPEYRTADMISPSKDKVKALAISAAAEYIGNMLSSINLSQANEFLSLLEALVSSQLDDLPAGAQDIQVGDLEMETQQAARAAFQELAKQLQAKNSELSAYQESIDPESGYVAPAISAEIDRLNTEIANLNKEKEKLEIDLRNASQLISGIQRTLKNLGKSENAN